MRFDETVKLLNKFRWDISIKNYFKELDACRLVVNVYKHGEGQSFEDLKKKYPQYVGNSTELYRITDVKVNDQQIEAFSSAIVDFWKDIPSESKPYVP